MKIKLTKMKPGTVCLRCFSPMELLEEVESNRRNPDSPGCVGLCHICGHLMLMTDDAGFRDMTRAELLKLPNHVLADEIRDEQEKVVSQMWG